MFTLGFDDNLGLPKHFSQEIPCQLMSYHDLTELTNAFSSKVLNAIFIPVGVLPYVKRPYKILAQATLGSERKTTMCSHLCSHYETDLTNISHKKWGRVNAFCTTSYWAPLVYMLNKHSDKPQLSFEDTESFEDMLDKTLSGQISYAMIWDQVLKKHPESAKNLHTLLKVEDLPTPIIIGHNRTPQSIIQALQAFYSNDPHSFFNGFTKPDERNIETFKREILRVIE